MLMIVLMKHKCISLVNLCSFKYYYSVLIIYTFVLDHTRILCALILDYSLSILKRQLERNLSLIAAVPNDGCYSKQGATSYVYLQTFCVRQILRMRYWVVMPIEACIRMLVH